MPKHDLDATLITWGKRRGVYRRLAKTGTVCLGATGSGKTSGAGHLPRGASPTPDRPIPEGTCDTEDPGACSHHGPDNGGSNSGS